MSSQEPMIHFVSGKGGVGKSTVAAALALYHAEKGRRTLLVEIESNEQMRKFFGVPEKIGYRELKLRPNLFGINIDSFEALKEYLQLRLKVRRLYEPLLSFKIFQQIVTAAPGLRELVMLGKIWHLAERRKDPETGKSLYSSIVIDAPATGHGLLFLRTPQTTVEAIQVGPIRREAKKVLNVLKDPNKTRLHLVTLAEEMPVNETLEMIDKLKRDIPISLGTIWVNALYPKLDERWSPPAIDRLKMESVSSEYSKAIREAAKDMYRYQKRQQTHLNHLRSRIAPLECKEIPFIFATSLKEVELHEIARKMHD